MTWHYQPLPGAVSLLGTVTLTSITVSPSTATIEVGETQQFTATGHYSDGSTADLTATVSRFASDPQFTPPIIYSRDERNRLVFQAEAVLDQQNAVLPGQPVSIGLAP